jgi:hypothetical protein
METTWDITGTESRAVIISRVAAVARRAVGGRLRHLVISGHGSPGHLSVGEGFGEEHIALFAGRRGLVEKIWLPNCRVAGIPDAAGRARGERDGNAFCSGLARQARCYVVASTERQVDLAVSAPADMMTSFEGLVLSYGPQGTVTWQQRYPSTYTTADRSGYYNP